MKDTKWRQRSKEDGERTKDSTESTQKGTVIQKRSSKKIEFLNTSTCFTV